MSNSVMWDEKENKIWKYIRLCVLDFVRMPCGPRSHTHLLLEVRLVSYMDPQPPQSEQKPLQSPPLHSDDADEDDQSVKQLRECSTLYLSLQVCVCVCVHSNINMYTRVLITRLFLHIYCRIVLLIMIEIGNLVREVCLFPSIFVFCNILYLP